VVFIALVVLPTMQMLKEFSDTPLSSTINNVFKGLTVPVNHWLMSILSPSILVLSALVAMFCKDLKKLLADNRAKITGFILAVLSFLLIVAAFGKLSLDPWRQAVDLATVVAMLIAVCLGLLLPKQKNVALYVVVALAIGFGLFHNLPTWFSYNSAIRQVDVQAIEYANNYKTFSCSSQIAPWVYMRYTEAKHRDNEGEIVIMRDKPMTPRSTKDNVWYQYHGWTPDLSYELVEVFDDGVVRIEIYGVKDFCRWEHMQKLLVAKQSLGEVTGSPEILATTGWRCPECGESHTGYNDGTSVFTDNPPVLEYKCDCGYYYCFAPIGTGNWYAAVYGDAGRNW
jgi:DNA-directed RNA polymerase subunit M/transcription elongation factor TFIIS